MLTLETPRLLLRPYTDDDAAFVLDLYSRREVQQFLGVSPKLMKDSAEALALIAAWNRLDDGTCGVWAVQVMDAAGSEHLAGTLLLKPIPASGPERKPSGDIEIGRHFHPDSWGKGYAPEAAAAVLDHALARGLPKVVAVINPANGASRRVCEKVGLHHQGTSDRYYNAVCELFSTERPACP